MPALLFFTDPVRTPDPEAIARCLPAGSGIVFRSFGAPDAETRALRLLRIARRRGLTLLIGQDVGLASHIGADGVHLPERLAHCAMSLRRRHPGWLVTSAAHSLRAARASQAMAVVVSSAFASNSTSAGRPLGPRRLATLVRAAGRPIYALGGINSRTAVRLRDVGVIGLAAVEGLAT